jgi:hypothetical protein
MRRFVPANHILAAVALALVNVYVPIGILRLAAGRRVWRVRTLMVLPVVAAMPLWVFQTVELLLPPQIGTRPVSARMAFVVGTLAGVPAVWLRRPHVGQASDSRLHVLDIIRQAEA